MEFTQVLGRQRTFHYFASWRPVEREKIQAMLEAARRASRGMNCPFFKAIVVYRDQLTQEERDRLKTPWARAEFDLAPVYILWYHDTESLREHVDGLKPPTVPSGALQDAAVMAPLLGWSRRFLHEVILPELLMPGVRAAQNRDAGPPTRSGNADAAMAMEQAVLCAFDEGLAATLVPFDEEGARAVLDAPATWEPVMAILVGYPAESWEAGGQAPRPAFREMFFEGSTERPWERDPEVVERPRADGLVQAEAPVAWRDAEMRGLDRMLRLSRNESTGEESAAPAPTSPLAEPIREYESVRLWLKEYAAFWNFTPSQLEADEEMQTMLATLERACAFMDSDPDAMVGECLRPAKVGEGLVLRVRARRKYIDLIAAFEQQEGSRDAGNAVRSFFIHNGVAMTPSALR